MWMGFDVSNWISAEMAFVDNFSYWYSNRSSTRKRISSIFRQNVEKITEIKTSAIDFDTKSNACVLNQREINYIAEKKTRKKLNISFINYKINK